MYIFTVYNKMLRNIHREGEMFHTTKPLSVTHPLTQVRYNTVLFALVTELPGRLQTLFLPRA